MYTKGLDQNSCTGHLELAYSAYYLVSMHEHCALTLSMKNINLFTLAKQYSLFRYHFGSVEGGHRGILKIYNRD